MPINLGSRSNDTNNWTNLLFVVVMAVVWLIGGIAKTVRKGQTENEQSGHKPAGRITHGKPDHPIVVSREELGGKKKATTAVEPTRDQLSQSVSSEPDQALTTTSFKSDISHGSPQDYTAGTTDLNVPSEQAPVLFLSEIPLNTLQGAILYSEILGKPLSLRTTSDETLLN